MATITFTSIDNQARTATFDVDGKTVVRNIPEVYAGTIDDYLLALAQGLAIEFEDQEVTNIDDPTWEEGQIVIQ